MIMTPEEELEEVTAWTVYRWTCPYCTEVDEDEIEPSGEVECRDCGEKFIIKESM